MYETTSKAALLAQYKALLIRRLSVRCIGPDEMMALAAQTGRCLGELRYRFHTPESEIDAIRAAVINGGAK